MKQFEQILSDAYHYPSFRENILNRLFGDNTADFVCFSEVKEMPVPDNTAHLVASIGQLGHLTTADKIQVNLYEIKLQTNVWPEMYPLAQTKIFNSLINNNKAALVVLVPVGKNTENWRITLINNTIQKSEKTKTKHGQATRYTFLLGKNQNCQTAAMRFQNLANIKNLYMDSLQVAFSVKILTKEFLKEYTRNLRYLSDYLIKNNDVTAIFGNEHPEKKVSDFAKMLLGRIVFLYFVQKKGWLRPPNSQTDYFQHLCNKANKNDDFYTNYLHPLFSRYLNSPSQQQKCLLSGIDTGFAPGFGVGFFRDDFMAKLPIKFPSDYFDNLFAFFGKHNFTLIENAPPEHTIAVDPEMLGNIFENLLDDNKTKGAYYTPKEIVHYMCCESIADYLTNKLTAVKIDQKQAVYLREFINYKTENEFITNNLATIDKALNKVLICDPAIGSGAFPLGMLSEIHSLKLALRELAHQNGQTQLIKSINAENSKRNFIQNNLFGVDIEQGAVEIVKLRFWLSLIIDAKTPQTLPRPDYKILCGNSLIPNGKLTMSVFNPQQNSTIGASEALLKSYVEKKKLFFDNQHDRQSELKREIEDLKTQISKSISQPGFIGALANNNEKKSEISQFDWLADFAEVLHPALNPNSGFDIVIGNPPYGANLSNAQKQFCRTNYESARSIKGLQKASMDTFSLFIELGIKLLKNGGNLNFIVPIAITSSDSMEVIHKMLQRTCSKIHISSYSVRPQPVFDNAVVNTSILFCRNDGKKAKEVMLTKMYRKNHNFNLQHLINNLEFINVLDFKLHGRYPKISYPIERQILNKIFSARTSVSQLLRKQGQPVYYRTTGGRYFKVITNYSTGSNKEKTLFFAPEMANIVAAILSSNLYFWFYQIYSNNLDLKAYEIQSFHIPTDKLNHKTVQKLNHIYELYLTDIESNANIRQTQKYANINTFKEYKIGKSKHLIDLLDDLICPLYGLDETETLFIKNYEIEFRLGLERS